MKSRKLFSLILALCLILTCMPMMARAEEGTEPTEEEVLSGSCGDTVSWTLDATGLLTISGSGDIYYYDSNIWKKYSDRVTALVVEEGVTGTIGEFTGYPNLRSVSLPSTIDQIGKNAFYGCTSLTNVVLPANLKEIGSNAFYGCTGLTEIHIPASVTALGARPFGGCTNLTGIWADSASEFFASDERGVLYSKDMSVLIEAPGMLTGAYTIADTATSIQWGAFDGCTKLTSVVIPYGEDWLELHVFYNCTSLTQVVIPDSVTYIQMQAFENCTSLKELTIPASVTEIDALAFLNSGLESITFMGDAPAFRNGCFEGLTAVAYYPADNATWTEEVMQSYGGNITWVPYTEPEVTEPEVTEPEVTEPEVTEPEVTEPEVTEPEVTEPEVTEPEVTEPEVTEPEVTEPEVTEPEVTEPEVTEPEVTEPEVTEPEVTEPEVTEPEVTEPEVTEPETTEPETTESGEAEPQETKPADQDSPATGDCEVILMMALVLLTGAALIAMVAEKKRMTC